MKYTYKSVFKDVIKELIDEKHNLGFKYETMEWKLKEIDLLALKLNITEIKITKEFVTIFIKRKPNESKINIINRVSTIRILSQFLNRKGFKSYVIPSLPKGSYQSDFIPYIFSDNELKNIFQVCNNIDFNKFPEREKYTIILKILYSTGMRIGEVVKLKVKDINFDNNTFFIECAKNNKNRLIPIHKIIIELIKNYIVKRKIFNQEDYIFSNKCGNHIDISTVYEYFRRILWKAGIHHNGKGPRLHDFRHTYCVHKLKQWVLEGKDVNALFPYLCAYMGHADTRCTEYYLRLTTDLYPDIITKTENYFNGDKK